MWCSWWPAAVGFAAVVFSTIGVLGQAVVLLAVCAGAAAGSRACARRALPGSAEALAVVAVAVGVVVLAQAHAQGLFGLDAVPDATWAVLALAVVCAACAAAAVRLRVGGAPRAYGWAAVAAGALLPSAVTDALDGRAPTWSAAALVLTAGCAAVAPLVRGHGAGQRVALAVVGGAHLAGALLVLLGLVAVGDRDADLLAAAAQLAVLGVGAAALARRPPAARPHLTRLARALAWSAPAGAAVALSALGDRPG